MASATDIITYVGVPLTVMGIMPILWNFCKAFWIRFRLSQTIPWELRPFYTLSADGANGEVTVVINSISCVHPGLWPDELKRTGVQCNLSPGTRFKRWSHRVFYRLLYKCEPMHKKLSSVWNKIMSRWSIRERVAFSDTDADNHVGKYMRENPSLPAVWTWNNNKSLEPEPFCLSEPDLLFRPWMAVAAKLGLCVHKESEYSHGLFLKRPALRFTVSTDMEIPKNPELAMDGTDFLWLALALGVDPFFFDPTKPNFNGESLRSYSEPVMRFLEIDGDWYFEVTRDAKKQQHSIRRALAWVNVMCSERDGNVYCRPLRSPKSDETPLTKQSFHLKHFQPFKYQHSNPANNRRALAAALSWGLYEYFEPVSQWMVEIQERSLCYLYGLEKSGALLKKLGALFCRNKVVVAVYNGPPNSSDVASEAPTEDPIEYHMIEFIGTPIAMGEEGNDENEEGRCMELIEKTQGRDEENQEKGCSARAPRKEIIGQEVNRSDVEWFHQRLNQAFERSEYVQKSHHVGMTLRRIGERIRARRDTFALSNRDFVTELEEDFPQLKEEAKPPLQPGLCCMPIGGGRWEPDSLTETLWNHEKFQELRESLDEYRSTQTEEQEGEWGEDMEFLAHVILGCQLWGMRQCEPWEVQETSVSDLQQIRQGLEDCDYSDIDDLCHLLEEAAGRAESGFYTASKEPICDLLDKFRSKGTVYLI
ncbi:hypothetical protein BKA81DRAFT_431316 [Phyllosticta paracitricarpa]|uniref:Uncharacterized protein n=1 Tax=Phyllosticta paracitricarpa TaxID=2016321 RepID=A0ABR1N584_9PEZI